MQASNVLFEKASAEQIVTLRRGSMAVKLKNHDSMQASNVLFEKFSAVQIWTLMRGSMAGGMEEADLRQVLFEKFSAEQIVTFNATAGSWGRATPEGVPGPAWESGCGGRLRREVRAARRPWRAA